MQQIGDWLNRLGLAEYTQRFVENGIDVGVLRDLTEEDLKELGLVVGHRRKLLRAIAELEGARARRNKRKSSRSRRIAPNDGSSR